MTVAAISAPAPRPAELEAARLLLSRLGISPTDLLAIPRASEVPLLADYIPKVAAIVSDGARQA